MNAITLTLTVDEETKARLDVLAKDTGREPSQLAVEAIEEYLNVSDWQVAGIASAIASLDQNGGVPHTAVKDWIKSWNDEKEAPRPEPSPR